MCVCVVVVVAAAAAAAVVVVAAVVVKLKIPFPSFAWEISCTEEPKTLEWLTWPPSLLLYSYGSRLI